MDEVKLLIERDDAAAPRLVGEVDDQLQRLVAVFFVAKEDLDGTFEGAEHGG